MSHVKVKIIISVMVILVALVTIRLLTVENVSTDEGSIYLYITDQNQDTVFEGELSYIEGDSFYDILDRHFDLTCATQTYQPDETCSYSFTTPGAKGKVILGITGEGFSVMTNWTDYFLAFYTYDDGEKRLTTVGPSNIPFQDGDQFMICYETIWE